jgi:hypothetical protein
MTPVPFNSSKTPAGQQAVLEGWGRQIANGTLQSKGRMIDPKRPHQGPFDVFEGAGFTLQRDLDGNLRSVHRTTSAMAQRFVCFGG